MVICVRDRIDEHVERWQRELPELEPRVEAITARMHLLVRFLRQGRQHALAGQTLQWWEYKTLLELRRRGKPYRATPKELAAALGLSPAGVTKRLTALERQGYVSRSHDTGDRRLVHVTLTRQGHQAWRRATSSESEIEKKLISQLTVSEQDELARLLRCLLIASESL
jgi:DNA-binding MarR family transcriptional regulator